MKKVLTVILTLLLTLNVVGCSKAITDNSTMKKEYQDKYSESYIRKTEVVAKTCSVILLDMAKKKDFDKASIIDINENILIPYLNNYGNFGDSTQKEIADCIDKFTFSFQDYKQGYEENASSETLNKNMSEMESALKDLEKYFN